MRAGCVEKGERRCFRALGHDFGLEAFHPLLQRFLEDLYAPLASVGSPSRTYAVRQAAADPTTYELWYGEERLVSSPHPDEAVAILLWHVNQQVVARSPELIRLHAAAASRGAEAVLLPAPMEHGKTTLVAGLVRDGWQYLTDEVAALEPGTRRLLAYPKPLSLDPGSWPVLAELEPDVPAEVRPYLPEQWQVPATAIRSTAIAAQAEVVLVVAPRYRPDADLVIEPLEGAEALALLAQSTFALGQHPERDLRGLAAVVRSCPCYRMTYGDLSEGCAAVTELFKMG